MGEAAGKTSAKNGKIFPDLFTMPSLIMDSSYGIEIGTASNDQD
jgi:hypothetical protein